MSSSNNTKEQQQQEQQQSTSKQNQSSQQHTEHLQSNGSSVKSRDWETSEPPVKRFPTEHVEPEPEIIDGVPFTQD